VQPFPERFNGVRKNFWTIPQKANAIELPDMLSPQRRGISDTRRHATQQD
jgi:hypothetical protein